MKDDGSKKIDRHIESAGAPSEAFKETPAPIEEPYTESQDIAKLHLKSNVNLADIEKSNGLSSDEAAERLKPYGRNVLTPLERAAQMTVNTIGGADWDQVPMHSFRLSKKAMRIVSETSFSIKDYHATSTTETMMDVGCCTFLDSVEVWTKLRQSWMPLSKLVETSMY